MSRNDIIFVKQIKEHWYVLYAFAAHQDLLDADFLLNGNCYANRGLALMAAHDLDHDEDYTRYGVVELAQALPQNFFATRERFEGC